MKAVFQYVRSRLSLFWRYFFLLSVVVALFLSALSFALEQSAKALQDSYLEQAQQSFRHNSETFSANLQRTYNLLDLMKNAPFFSYAKRATPPLTSEYTYYLSSVGEVFFQQSALLNLPSQSFLYFHQSQTCCAGLSYFPQVEDCFSTRLVYQNGLSMPQLLADCVTSRAPTLTLLPACPVSVSGGQPETYLTLLLPSSPHGQVYGFLYSEQTILDAFHMSALPEGSYLQLISTDGTVLYSHNATEAEGYTSFSATLPALSATAVLGIPHAYFQNASREVQSSANAVFLLCMVVGVLMCFLFSHMSVRPFRRLIRDHGAAQSTDAPRNELAVIDRALRSSRQRSDELRGILMSSLLVRTFSGIPISDREVTNLTAAFPVFRQSLQTAVIRDCSQLHDRPDGQDSLFDRLHKDLSSHFLCEYVSLQECIILFQDDPAELELLQKQLLELNTAAGRPRFVCGVSAPFLGLDELPTAVQQAQFALPESSECVFSLYSGDAPASRSSAAFDLKQFQRSLAAWDLDELRNQLETLSYSVGKPGAPQPEETFYSILYLLRETAGLGGLSFTPYEAAAYQHTSSPASNLRYLGSIINDLFQQRDALQSSARTQLCEDIVQYAKDNFADPNLCMASLSQAFYVSESFIRSAVQGVTGTNFTNYLTTLRMEEAGRLLRETNLPNSSICQQCGYTALSTFYRNFRRYYRMSPAEYKSTPG